MSIMKDSIKSRSNHNGWGRRQGERRGWGQYGSFDQGRDRRRGPLRANPWPTPFANAKPFRRPKEFMRRNVFFKDDLAAAGLAGISSGTKLYISNLDFRVSNQDIKELFSEIGELKRYAIHYDRNGKSNGSAEVVFARRSEALAAVKRYNNVQLDGRPMKVELVGTSSGAPLSARVNVTGVNGRSWRTVVMRPLAGQGIAPLINRAPRRNFRGSRRGNQVQGRVRYVGGKKPFEKSANELDKDLEEYHAEAMNTS